MTPHEVCIFCEAHGRAETAIYRRAMWQAWHTAAFQREKKLSNLKGLMERMRMGGEKPQTPKEMLKVVKGLTAAFGGKDLTRAEKN